MKRSTKSKRKARKPLFASGRTVSFKMDGPKADLAQKAAWDRNIPFSMWMREAAEEKFARETQAA